MVVLMQGGRNHTDLYLPRLGLAVVARYESAIYLEWIALRVGQVATAVLASELFELGRQTDLCLSAHPSVPGLLECLQVALFRHRGHAVADGDRIGFATGHAERLALARLFASTLVGELGHLAVSLDFLQDRPCAALVRQLGGNMHTELASILERLAVLGRRVA
ncbi:hypothetical protein L1887_49900 [Cichorium endivia]|nr:hypothetical protein L1887_49900 [Cichorium endivia]